MNGTDNGEAQRIGPEDEIGAEVPEGSISLTPEDLMSIVGQKEVQLVALRAELERVRGQLAEKEAALESLKTGAPE